MNTRTNIDQIRRIIEPGCVAIIGASEDTAKYGGRVIDHLVRHGYKGRILPINAQRKTILGLPAIPSVLAAGCSIDVALLAVPEAALEETIADCVKAGVGCAVIIASGLGEKDDQGKRRQREMVRLAREGGMRILGPNCLGFVSPHADLAVTPSFAMNVPTLPRGGVALLSQSGALMATMFARGADNGTGFRACVSLGNQADLVFEDFLEYFADDDKSSAIVVYSEEIRDSTRFFDACRRARTNGKPVVVCKAGSSAAGRGTTLSHTASVAGDHAAFKAACVRHGVLLTNDPDSASICATAVAKWGTGHGRRVAIVSGSGGGVVVAADYLTGKGFEVPELEPSTTARMRLFYDTFSGYAAVDYGALPPGMKGREAWINALADILENLARDANVDAIVYVMTAQPQMIRIAELVAGMARNAAKPLLLCLTAGSAGAHVREKLRETCSPFVDRIDEVAQVLAMLAEPAADDRHYFPDDRVPAERLPPPDVLRLLTAPGGVTEQDARAVLRAIGAQTAAEGAVSSFDEALAVADRIGYPVVLKATCNAVVHKTDRGLVKLGIRDRRSLHEAWTALDEAVNDEHNKSLVAGRVVQRQLDGGLELFVGTRWAEGIGPVVAAGFGGLFVEVVNDVAVCAAPVTPAGAEAMLRKLKLWPLLAGARGGRPLDVRAVADVISNVSILAAAAGSVLREMDVNPLIVFEENCGAVAVDCRISRSSTSQEHP